jgi:hypothetical protein
MLDRRTFLGTSLAASLVGIGEAEAATSLGQYVVLPGDGTGSARTLPTASASAAGPSATPPAA